MKNCKVGSNENLEVLDSGGRRAMKVLRPLCRSHLLKWRPEHWNDRIVAWHAERHAFHVATVLSFVGRNATVCDIGGGWGHVAAACAQVGMNAISIDRESPADDSDPRVRMSQEYGFELRIQDVTRTLPGFTPGSVDAFLSFDCIEHLHHSPKAYYHELIRALRPGGLFFLGAPNCVNLRKRITVPLGKGKWSSMQYWYEEPYFRSHVREPDVQDLRYIARDLGLTDVRIFGRNWGGYLSDSPWVARVTYLVNPVLCLFPSLCADIYMTGRKPHIEN